MRQPSSPAFSSPAAIASPLPSLTNVVDGQAQASAPSIHRLTIVHLATSMQVLAYGKPRELGGCQAHLAPMTV